MEIIEWNDSLSVQIKEIDDQHKELVGIINRLNRSMVFREEDTVMKEILESLINYITIHFTTEEQYFDQFKFSDAKQHKHEHKEFIAKVVDFQNGFNNNKITLSIEMMYFLKKWLLHHIKISDKKYIALFHEKGLY